MFKRTSKLAPFPECPHCGARAVVTAPNCRELACCSCGTTTPMRSLEQVRADLEAARTEPLDVNDRRITKHQFTCLVLDDKTEKGGRPVLDQGRFATEPAAQAWADRTWAHAPVVLIEHKAARSGWQRRLVSRRTAEGWKQEGTR